MKQRILLLFLGVVSVVQAQDSLRIQRDYPHYFYQTIQQNFHENPELYRNSPIAEYTLARFTVAKEHRFVRSAANAEKVTDLNLEATGIYRLKSALLVGDMSYVKNFEKGHGFNLTNRTNFWNQAESTPFKKLAYALGDWNNQLFKLNGALVFPVSSDTFFAKLGGKYQTSQFYKTIQPKPRILSMFIEGDLGLFWKLSSFTVGVHGTYGVITEESDIIYDGEASYFNIPVNVDLFLRSAFGLGSIETAIGLDHTSYESRAGFGASVMKTDKEVRWHAKAEFKRGTNKFYNSLTTANDRYLLGTYTYNTTRAKFQYYDFGNGQQFDLSGVFSTGNNYKVSTQGKNYDARFWEAKAGYQKVTRSASSVTANYGVQLGLHQLQKKDYQVLNSFKYTNAALTVFYSSDIAVNKSAKLYGRASLGGRTNLSKQQLFSLRNTLVDQEIAPFVALETAKQVQGELQLGYQYQFKHATYVDFGVKVKGKGFLSTLNLPLQTGRIQQLTQAYVTITY